MQQQPLEKKMKPFPMEPYNHNPSEVKFPEFCWDSSYSMASNRTIMANMDHRGKWSPGVFHPQHDPVLMMPFEERYPKNGMFNEVYGKNLTARSKAEFNPSVPSQETSLYFLFEGTLWSPSLPAGSDYSTPARQSPHSSNPSSLPSSPPTYNHNSVPFSKFGPIGTPDNRDRGTADQWKTDKPAMGGLGVDYLSATSSSESS
ncbi:Protein SMG7 [Heterocephalus glaber]|uniref:Protein SMG7 n=1 Tax=Heterocephalus glaber TaxID=10181 RepID=G5APD0_HETGA|nr:Protein SMG7 [Heterocephalus glaber]